MRAVIAGLAVVIGVLAWASTPVAAFAQPTCYTGCTTPSVPQPKTVSQVSQPGEPSTPGEPAGGGGLPFTGSDIAELSGLGFAVLGVGALLAYRGRRTSGQPG